MQLIKLRGEFLRIGDAKRDVKDRSLKMSQVGVSSIYKLNYRDRAVETNQRAQIVSNRGGNLYALFYIDGSIQPFLAPIDRKPLAVRYVDNIPSNFKEIQHCRSRNQTHISQEERMMLRGVAPLCPNL